MGKLKNFMAQMTAKRVNADRPSRYITGIEPGDRGTNAPAPKKKRPGRRVGTSPLGPGRDRL